MKTLIIQIQFPDDTPTEFIKEFAGDAVNFVDEVLLDAIDDANDENTTIEAGKTLYAVTQDGKTL